MALLDQDSSQWWFCFYSSHHRRRRSPGSQLCSRMFRCSLVRTDLGGLGGLSWSQQMMSSEPPPPPPGLNLVSQEAPGLWLDLRRPGLDAVLEQAELGPSESRIPQGCLSDPCRVVKSVRQVEVRGLMCSQVWNVTRTQEAPQTWLGSEVQLEAPLEIFNEIL